ncbi:uroporphyrinogen decarboxylase family protein [Faecalicatena contorta]|uniref:uroporphyrinogen decarboxylase family protein n=1 Tax=Faecalicatena contorta TaxID=39482 RepID=UPI001FAAEEFA|nr:uroporphyrinogen decarboxylase family protein [Faecalicatena contorta]
MVERYRQFCDTHAFLGESFPNLDVDFGPGAMASYLGAEICFQEDTVWYKSCIEEWEDADDFLFRPNSKWFRQHLNLVKQCKELANGDFLIPMPDIMENIDVIASLRGAQNTLFDLVDEPELIKNRITQITNIYYDYFNQFYEEIKEEEGGNAYAVFQIWGPGRTVKLQCDFSAMLSPDNFREFIQESLRVQAQKADCVLYHLDGSDAIRHLDSLMEIEEIDALQWSSGDTAPDGTMEEWDEIYDKVRKAGKSLWIKVYTGEFEDWIKNAERIVKKYGSAWLFFDFPEMSMEQGKTLLSYAESNWSNIAGTFDIEVK